MSGPRRMVWALALGLGLAGCARPERPFGLPPNEQTGRRIPSGLAPQRPAGSGLFGPLPLDEPLASLLEAERRQARVRSVQAFVDTRLEGQGRSLVLRARLLFVRPSRVRYEHLDPVQQTLVSDGTGVCLRAAGSGAWTRHELADLDAPTRAAWGLVPGFGLDPLAPLPVDAYTYAFEDCGSTRCTVLARPRPGRPLRALRIELAPALGVLTRFAVCADLACANWLVESVLDDFVEAVPGVLFPRRSVTRWALRAGAIVLEQQLRAPRFGDFVPDERFRCPEASDPAEP